MFSGIVKAQYLFEKQLSVYFDVDQDLLRQNFMDDIRAQILEIGTLSLREIYIKAHADSDASDNYNQELSEKRAQSTSAFLQSQGVPTEMIKFEAFGETAPVSDVKKYNRRVDLIFKYERFISNEDVLKKRVVEGLVKNALTLEPLQAEFIFEGKKQQASRNTNLQGYFRLQADATEDLSLTFIKNGFLNAHYMMIADEIALSKADTIRIQILLSPVQVIDKITLPNIYFYTDTDVLRPESYPDLEKLLKTLTDKPQMLIEIQGHMNYATNRKMTAQQKEYNFNLSHRRAKAIYNFLVSNGVDRKRLSYRGMSNYRMIFPVPKNRQEEDMNKRVEIYSLKLISS